MSNLRYWCYRNQWCDCILQINSIQKKIVEDKLLCKLYYIEASISSTKSKLCWSCAIVFASLLFSFSSLVSSSSGCWDFCFIGDGTVTGFFQNEFVLWPVLLHQITSETWPTLVMSWALFLGRHKRGQCSLHNGCWLFWWVHELLLKSFQILAWVFPLPQDGFFEYLL